MGSELSSSPAREPVEVLDESGAVVGVVTRGQMRAANLPHRNVVVALRRSDGRWVVHRRADWKDVNPGLWDVAFGGVPAPGESDTDAAVRELAEEAGVAVDADRLVEVARLRHADDRTRWSGPVYVVVDDGPVVPADGEVAEVAEVAAGGLTAWAAGHPLCPDARTTVLPVLVALDGSGPP